MEQIEALFLAGVDVFRLNFSHGAHDEKAKVPPSRIFYFFLYEEATGCLAPFFCMGYALNVKRGNGFQGGALGASARVLHARRLPSACVAPSMRL